MEQFNEYNVGFPWWTLKFYRDSNTNLMNVFGVKYIPHLIVVNRHGLVASNNGVADLKKHKELVFDKWNESIG